LQEFDTNFFEKYFAKNIFYKKIIENICEFYNFVKDNYPHRNYMPIKILWKNNKKKILANNL